MRHNGSAKKSAAFQPKIHRQDEFGLKDNM
jgi:hypothetical protein